MLSKIVEASFHVNIKPFIVHVSGFVIRQASFDVDTKPL